MSTHINQDVSPEVLDLARLIQSMIDNAVRRSEAERTVAAEPPPPAEVDVKGAARILGVKPRTVYAYVEQGRLHPRRTGPKGGKLMFRREEVERAAGGGR